MANENEIGKYEQHARDIGGSPMLVDRSRAIDLWGHNQTTELYNQLLSKTSSHLGIDQGTMEEFMNIIMYHESDRTMDAALVHPNAGRGAFGYEISEESDVDKEYEFASGSARTAMNRVYAQIGGVLANELNPRGKKPLNLPKIMEPFFEGTNAVGDVDPSQLSLEMQKILFLADHLEGGDFNNIGKHLIRSGEYARWWGDYHHRGEEPDIDIFLGNMKDYYRQKKNK
jgi:hypothetical protein